VVRPQSRSRWYAADLAARTRKCPQALRGPRRRPQSWHPDAAADRGRNPERGGRARVSLAVLCLHRGGCRAHPFRRLPRWVCRSDDDGDRALIKPALQQRAVSGVEDCLDSAAYPTRRLGLACPDRGKDLHHEGGIDRRYGQIADHRVDVGFEGILPLPAMLLVPPAGFLVPQQFLGDLLECLDPSFGEALCLPLSSLCGERIYSINLEPPAVGRALAGIGERDRRIGTEAHVTAFTIELISVNPPL